MAPWKIGPIRRRIKNSRWRRPRKSAMLENSSPASTEDWDRFHGFPWRHKSRQGHAKNVMQLQNRYLQCPVVLNDRGPSGKWPWWRLRDLGPSLAQIGWCKTWWDNDLIGIQSEWIKNIGFPQAPLLKERNAHKTKYFSVGMKKGRGYPRKSMITQNWKWKNYL